jgi:hypothetical protein
MKLRVGTAVTLVLTLGACGGVREQIRVASASKTPTFDRREFVDVLPPDRIPAITRPAFESGALAMKWLKGFEPVVALAVGAEARAYPLAILVWHEIVDDVVGGAPVVVTYAPLANAAIVFDRRLTGGTAVFAVSGKLYRSDLVMFDRATRSLWTQLDGRAAAGRAKGETLARLPSQIVSLNSFLAAYPAGVVLARPATSGRAYGFNPYAGYDSRRRPFGGFIALSPDGRRPPMDRVVGISVGAEAGVVGYRELRRQRVVAARLGGRDVVVLWAPGARSALDSARMVDGRDVGETGVFSPEVAGRRLDLTAAPGGGFRDSATGSTWSVLGLATSGPMRGTRLVPVDHVDTFWFAWSAFYPGTSA